MVLDLYSCDGLQSLFSVRGLSATSVERSEVAALGLSQIIVSKVFVSDKNSPRSPFSVKARCVFQSNWNW